MPDRTDRDAPVQRELPRLVADEGRLRYDRAGMKPKLRVWVTFGDDLKFGDGRARLLALIDEHGSLKQAAEALAMSYRHAWGYLRELERAAGFKFVERAPGGGPRSGMRLTADGRHFVERYQRFRAGIDAAMQRQFVRTFQTRHAPRRRHKDTA